MVEKEVLTEEKANKEIEAAKNNKTKLQTLFANEAYTRYRKKIAQYWAPLILDSAKPEYSLIYDSFNEGLEPIYFWLLDFMKDPSPSGLGLIVNKGAEELEASVGSGYFGEIGARATQMQKNAMEYLGAINQVIKSILNLMYDLKEFQIRLEAYDKLKNKDPNTKKEGEYALKGVWMDQVDIKKGKGSINMLAQDLRFVTIRDAFFIAESSAQINEKDFDLNDRVKRILIQKLSEYESWKKYSEVEIRKRYGVEKSYLKQQVGSLKLYANWAKPYLKAAQKLKMKEFNTAHIVNAFSNIEMNLNLWGYKEIEPVDIHEKYEKIKVNKMYATIAVNMHFRSVPQTLQGQGGRHYIHGGRIDIQFKSYALSENEKIALEIKEIYEDMELVEEWVGTSLSYLQEELAQYLSNPEEEAPKIDKAKPKLDNPFSGLGDGFKEIFGGLVNNPFSNKKDKVQIYVGEKLKKVTEENAKELSKKIYTIYKKTHGMLAY